MHVLLPKKFFKLSKSKKMIGILLKIRHDQRGICWSKNKEQPKQFDVIYGLTISEKSFLICSIKTIKNLSKNCVLQPKDYNLYETTHGPVLSNFHFHAVNSGPKFQEKLFSKGFKEAPQRQHFPNWISSDALTCQLFALRKQQVLARSYQHSDSVFIYKFLRKNLPKSLCLFLCRKGDTLE